MKVEKMSSEEVRTFKLGGAETRARCRGMLHAMLACLLLRLGVGLSCMDYM